MKDLNLSRTINVLAFGSLTMSVVACGGKNKGEEEESPETSFCEALRECDASAFRDEYGSVSDCVEDLEYYKEYYADYYGRACGRAFSEILECSSDALGSDCDPYALEDECEDEFEAFYDQCY